MFNWEICLKGDYNYIDNFIREGNDINITDEFGITPLLYCISEGYNNIVRLLIENNVNINQYDMDGTSPLFLAVTGNNLEVCRLLVLNGALIDYQDNVGDTPLIEACREKYEDIVRLLVVHGANPMLSNKAGKNSLTIAAHYGYFKILKIMLFHLETISPVSMNVKRELLHLACSRNSQSIHPSSSIEVTERLQIIEYLVSECNVVIQSDLKSNNYQHYRDISPLFTCYNHCFYQLAHSLIVNYNLNLNTSNQEGYTILMLACRDNRIEIVNYLLECNVNIDQKNNDGETAILIACQRGYTNIVKKLLGKGANRNEINNEGLQLSTLAWLSNDVKMIELFLNDEKSL